MQEKEINLHKRGLKKIKYDPNVFHSLLSKTKEIKNSTKGLGISINNPEAKYNVIKVCNPYCDPCAKAHPILEDLVNAGKINLQVVFTAKADVEDIKAKPVSHFLTIAEEGNKQKNQVMLGDWYDAEIKEYDLFAEKYPIKEDGLEKQFNKIEAMYKWCDLEGITVTPTIFINNYKLPKDYSINDLSEIIN